MSVTFSSQLFAPTPAFFGGVGSSGGLVPHVYDVEIGGRPYMIDLGSDAYIVALEQRLRDSVDQGNVPGENTISSQGLWRRSQDTWHLGAGQYWADVQESQYGRFYTSVGVDPFTEKGALSLLKKSITQYFSAQTNPFLCRADNRLYFVAGSVLSFITELDAVGPGYIETAVTGTHANKITGMASDGYNVYITQADQGVYKTDAGVTTAASYVSNITAGPIGYVKGRLMVGGTGADQGHLWNITASGNNPTAFYIHPNNKFAWVGFAEGPNHIYCAGHTGAESLIYRTQVKADGTALDIPVVAGTLPMGEVVSSIYGYLGFVFIGTNKGVRMATADQNGDLVFGAVIPTGGRVNCFAGNDRFVFFGWSKHPYGTAGTGAIDLAYLTASNTPAFCSWVYRDGPPNIHPNDETFSLEVFNNQIVFGVTGKGIVRETSIPLANGFLETGAWTWGIPDKKIVAKIDGRHDPLFDTDTVRIAIKVDNGEWIECACVAPEGSPTTLFNPQQIPGFKIEAKIILKLQGVLFSPSIPPPVVTFPVSAFNRVNLRAYVNPERSLVLQVPVLLHPRLQVDGLDQDLDVPFELAHLRRLATEAQLTMFTDSMFSVRCIVEDVRWVPDNNRESIDRKWAGTALVTMRTVDEV